MTAKRFFIACTLTALSAGTMSCASARTPEPTGVSSVRPSLVVLVVVDQLRADQLDR